MQRLPKVLQNEIWDYVQGDRAYWKQESRLVIAEVEGKQPDRHFSHAIMLRSPEKYKAARLVNNNRGPAYVRTQFCDRSETMIIVLVDLILRDGWLVRFAEARLNGNCIIHFQQTYTEFSEARKNFRVQVLAAAKAAVRIRDSS